MRDLDLGGVYVPPILAIFVVTLAFAWAIDRIVAMTGCHDRVWHPALFRTALFVALFAAVALLFYR